MTEGERTQRGRKPALFLIGFGTLLGLVVLWHGAQPVGKVTGRVTGEVRRVVLSDPQRGVLRAGALSADGRYTCGIPSAARTPVVVLHGDEGSLIRSPAIALGEADGGGLPTYDLPTYALWTARIRIRQEDGTLRFDWSPLPTGPGFPSPFRYSLLITYAKADEDGDARGEASLLSRGPAMTILHQELIELLKDHDPARLEVEISIRAFNPNETEGALWVGSSRAWNLGK